MRMSGTPSSSWLAVLGGLLCVALSTGCVDDESIFTQGRLENLCDQAIPACSTQAGCVLTNKDFYRGQFPGGLRVLVRSELEDARLIVRFLLVEELFPGTELLVQANTTDCGDVVEEHTQDIDLFQFAGDDRTLDYELDFPGRGDHLVEIFSDMSARYLMTVTVEEK